MNTENLSYPRKIAITGSEGTMGKVLVQKLDRVKFDITPVNPPLHDARNLEDLVDATKGHYAIIHLAWKNLIENTRKKTIDPDNVLMVANVYEAARINKIPRVIMASSNHAHRHDLRDEDGRIRTTTLPTAPNNPYGAEKVFMEALGKTYAHDHGIDVVCWRIGNVNAEDKPKPSSPDNPQRGLTHADFGRLGEASLESDIPEHFQIVYGVSKQSVFDWTNKIGYEPQDSVE